MDFWMVYSAILTGLVVISIITVIRYRREALWLHQYYQDTIVEMKEKQELEQRKMASRQRAVIKGQLAEQFYPIMNGCNHHPSDMRFMGDFCDFVSIDGYTECKDEGKDYIDRITFIELKTGNAKPSRHQKLIREAVEAGRVNWETVRL